MEMLVSLLLATIVLGGVMSIYFSSIRHVKDSISLLNLRMELNVSADYMATEIRRSQFWNELAPTAPASSPFNVTAMNLQVNGAKDCVLFGYDKNGDGLLAALGTPLDDEHYGFRLKDNKVQARLTGANHSCTIDADWEDLTDPSLVVVSALHFALSTKNVVVNANTTVVLRKVVITITGQMVGDPSVTQTVQRTVKVRNNFVIVV